MFGRIAGKRPAGMTNEQFAAKLAELGIAPDEVTHYVAPDRRERKQLVAGTMVEVVDPNYKTRVVGTLTGEAWTGKYYEPVYVMQGHGRVAACGYVIEWKAGA